MSLTATDLDNFFESRPDQARQRPRDPYQPWRAELVEYAETMKGLRHQQPNEAMAWLSSISARVLEMQLHTLEHDDRAATKFRVEVVVPFREESRFQFQIASRRQSVAQMDWEITRGYES